MSVVVVDAAAVVDLLCGFPPAAGAGAALETATAVVAPAHLDAEVLSALARLGRAGSLPRVEERVRALERFGARRWPLGPLLRPALGLLGTVAARDALYVALAVTLEATLCTTDARLRRAAAPLVAVAPTG